MEKNRENPGRSKRPGLQKCGPPWHLAESDPWDVGARNGAARKPLQMPSGKRLYNYG